MCGTIAWDPRTHTHTHTAKHTATLTLTLLLKPTQPLKPQRVHKVMQRHKRLHALAARRAGAARVLGDQVAPLTHPATAAAAAAVRQSCRPLPPLTTHLWMQSRIFAKCSTASASTRPRSGSNRAHSRLRRKQLLPSDAARSMSCSYRRQKSQLCVRVCGRGEGGARQYLSRLAAARRRACLRLPPPAPHPPPPAFPSRWRGCPTSRQRSPWAIGCIPNAERDLSHRPQLLMCCSSPSPLFWYTDIAKPT